MALTLTLKDIAYELFQSDLAQDSDFSESSITAWLRENFAQLNNAINTSLELDSDTLEVIPNISENQKIIFKQMFYVFYLGWKVRSHLGSAALTVTEVRDALGGSVRLVDRNNIAKSFKEERKDAENTLKDMIAQYKINIIKPLDIQGRDNIGNSVSIIGSIKS